jgi:hypothetical protein
MYFRTLRYSTIWLQKTMETRISIIKLPPEIGITNNLNAKQSVINTNT